MRVVKDLDSLTPQRVVEDCDLLDSTHTYTYTIHIQRALCIEDLDSLTLQRVVEDLDFLTP